MFAFTLSRGNKKPPTPFQTILALLHSGAKQRAKLLPIVNAYTKEGSFAREAGRHDPELGIILHRIENAFAEMDKYLYRNCPNVFSPDERKNAEAFHIQGSLREVKS